MTTVLVAQDCDSPVIGFHRCSAFRRLLVRAHAYGLDRMLARGANPDSSLALSLRARVLIGPSRRRALARELRSVIELAQLPPSPFDARIRPCRREIWHERERLLELAERLDGADPVEACGVAQVEMLLRDGAGPLYYTRETGPLRGALERAIDALPVGSDIHADA